METKIQKLSELSKRLETLQETEKGMLKGGFVGISILSIDKKEKEGNPDKKNTNTNNSFMCSCSCTNN